MTPRRLFDVPEVLDVQVVPSDEVRMVPESPTETVVVVVVVLSVVVSSSVVEVVEVVEESSSLLLLQEMTVRLKRDMRIISKILFIFLLYQ